MTVGTPTAKHPAQLPVVPPLLLSTVTVRADAGAEGAMSMLAMRIDDETNVVEFTVMPVPENDTVAVLRNPVPDTVMF